MSTAFSTGKAFDQLSRVTGRVIEALEQTSFTLSLERWLVTLQEVEAVLVSACAEVVKRRNELTDSSCVILLRHFHDLHKRIIRFVPLEKKRWDHWRDGLQTCLWTRDFDGSTVSDDITKTQTLLLNHFRGLFLTHFWGCSDTVAIQLAECTELWLATEQQWKQDTDTAGSTSDRSLACKENEEEAGGVMSWSASVFEKRFFSPLQHFYRLRADTCHLFWQFHEIGEVEREMVESFLDGNDVVQQSAVRSSYKHDFSAASAALESNEMWEGYQAFEIDPKKEDEMKKLRLSTCRKAEFKALSSFYDYIRRAGFNSNARSAAESLFPLLDEEGNKLADAVVSVWRQSGDTCYAALAFTMQRVVELEAYPAVMNPSRLYFSLNLLHRWWSRYTASNHRWHARSVFAAEDDSDVWEFILQRHEVLLSWALLGKQKNAVDSSIPFISIIEDFRAVAQSLVHCLLLYLSNLDTVPMTAAKILSRRSSAVLACRKWLEEHIVNTASAALMNDIYREADRIGESKQEDEFFDEEEYVLPLEARLKLCLLDAFAPLAPYAVEVQTNNQTRLTGAAISIVQFLQRAKARSGEEDGVAHTVLKSLWTHALRILQRAILFVPPKIHPEDAAGVKSFINEVGQCFKTLILYAGETLHDEDRVEASSDAWRLFTTRVVVDGAAEEKLENSSAVGFEFSAPSYSSSLRKGSKSCMSLMDIAIERRKGLKSIRG